METTIRHNFNCNGYTNDNNTNMQINKDVYISMLLHKLSLSE